MCLGWEDGKDRGRTEQHPCLGNCPSDGAGGGHSLCSGNSLPHEEDRKHKNGISVYVVTFHFEDLPEISFLGPTHPMANVLNLQSSLHPMAPTQSLGLPPWTQSLATQPSEGAQRVPPPTNQNLNHFVHM